jgi:hypothetical protein
MKPKIKAYIFMVRGGDDKYQYRTMDHHYYPNPRSYVSN